MNSQSIPQKNQSLLLLVVLLILALSASFLFTQQGSTIGVTQENQSNQPTSPSQREMGIGVPKHIPIKIKVKNLNNEKWANDLEVEITNKSDKPIYYLSFLVIPQNENVADEKVAFWLHYGRPQLNNFSTPVESTDVPLLPNETCVLKIPESSANGWEAVRTKHNKPQPKKVGLVFQALNFGDGTGYMDTQGTPVDKHKRVALDQNCLSPPNQDQPSPPFAPAVFLPVNFFSSTEFVYLMNAIFSIR